ncbi:MAG: extracellular solute-binding protein [Treponema sp.]|nr:extracellular solute-binding protein [Treponema sp.]
MLKKKTLFVLVLLLAAALATVTAGGQSSSAAPQTAASNYYNKTGYPICNDTITVKLMGGGALAGQAPWNERIQVQEIEKRLGIKMDCTGFEQTVWNTQLNLMLASDDLPDIMVNCNVSPFDMYQFGSDGYFLPLNKYRDLMPFMEKLFKQYPVYETSMTSQDGNIYGIMQLNTNTVAVMPRVYINTVWLNNVGLDVPKTTDDLLTALRAFRDKDANGNGNPNDEIPMSYLFDTPGDQSQLESSMLAAFGISAVPGSLAYQIYADNGKVGIAETTDNYKAFLKYMNNLYKEKLLDPEVFIQTIDQYRAKAAADTLGVVSNASIYQLAGKPYTYDMNWAWFGGMTSQYNSQPQYTMRPRITPNGIAFISAKTKYPEALARLFDYFYDEDGEGTLAGRFGYEGLTFGREDLDYLPGKSVLATYKDQPGFESAEAFRIGKAVIVNAFLWLNSPKGILQGVIEDLPDSEIYNNQALFENAGWMILLHRGAIRPANVKGLDAFPTLTYTASEQTERNQLFTDITMYLRTAKAQFVSGGVDVDAGWDNYIRTLNNMGLPRLLAIDQAAYSRLK